MRTSRHGNLPLRRKPCSRDAQAKKGISNETRSKIVSHEMLQIGSFIPSPGLNCQSTGPMFDRLAQTKSLACQHASFRKRLARLSSRFATDAPEPLEDSVLVIARTLKSLSRRKSYWPPLHFTSSASRTPDASDSFSYFPPSQPQAASACLTFATSASVSFASEKAPGLNRTASPGNVTR